MSFEINFTGALCVLAIVGVIFLVTRKKKNNKNSPSYLHKGKRQADLSRHPAYHGVKPGSNSGRKFELNKGSRHSDIDSDDLLDHTFSLGQGVGTRSPEPVARGYEVPSPSIDNDSGSSSSFSSDSGSCGD